MIFDQLVEVVMQDRTGNLRNFSGEIVLITRVYGRYHIHIAQQGVIGCHTECYAWL